MLAQWCLTLVLLVWELVAGVEHLSSAAEDTATALKRCDSEILNSIGAQAEQQVLKLLAEGSQSGDVVYANITAACMDRKHEVLDAPACVASHTKYHLLAEAGKLYCTGRPYADSRYMAEEGMMEPAASTQNPALLKECRAQRYLLWTRNVNDFFSGHKHKWASLRCTLWEAYRLNRTLVMDSFVGMDKVHCGGVYDVEVPWSSWYNHRVFDLLPRGGMFYHDFVKGCGAPGVLQEANGDALVVPSGTSHANMVAAADVPLLVRDFSRETAEPYIKYGFEVCHPEKLPSPVFEPGVNYTLPAEISGSDWIYADWVYAKSNEIVAQLRAGADEVAATPGSSKIVCVQVRRGDLVITPSMRSRYPGLDVQTSAEAILDTLRPIVPEQSMLYIATNEQDPHFFDGLNARYHVRTLDYFLTPQEQSQLLPPSLTLLDYTILRSCDQLIPTFPAVDSKGEGSHGVSLYSHLRNSPGPG